MSEPDIDWVAAYKWAYRRSRSKPVPWNKGLDNAARALNSLLEQRMKDQVKEMKAIRYAVMYSRTSKWYHQLWLNNPEGGDSNDRGEEATDR